MITMNSTLREVYQNPIGKDIIDTLLTQTGKSPALVTNPLVASLKLSALESMFGKKAPGLAESILRLLNSDTEAPPESPATITRKWWKEAVVYQIYPRSFQDSNGDGIGDLAGIRSRIPYLKELGVDVLWLSPIYDSPKDYMGYDIRNYRKIMTEFGNMASFNALLAALHKNGMKLIMDLVVNHTSDEHEWFQKALKDPESPTRDYYIWAKGKNENKEEPNNWISFFSGPAWNYYEEQKEWALHLFSKKQMDLNWDNPALRHEVYDMINWWLEKGVDGFRMDVINFISKDSLADGNELVGKYVGVRGIEHFFYGPHLHEYLQEMRRETFGKFDTLTVGETPGLGINMCKMLTAEERGELDLAFNFDHLETPGHTRMDDYLYDLRFLKTYFLKWQQNYGNNCWPSLFFENHDNPRIPSKVTKEEAFYPAISKLLAVLQFTLKGTPFVYQGQELGMTNNAFAGPEEFRDVEAINLYRELLPAKGPEDAFTHVMAGLRDHARTPMQWSAGENAGFTTGTPWLVVNTNHTRINTEAEAEDPDSVLNFYKAMIALRKGSEALVYGEFHPVFLSNKNTFCYFRKSEGESYYVEINLTGQEQKRPGPLTGGHLLVAGNYGGVVGLLRPYEANLYKVSGEASQPEALVED
ncbi:MAG: alpha-glucosidase [Oscillospiraceae bacterium]